MTVMSLKRFQDPNLQRSFLWLFYAGFILILLGESILLPTERTPVFLSQIGNVLHWLGAGLLLLRIATLLPAYPRYTLTCICMLVAFRASFSWPIPFPRSSTSSAWSWRHPAEAT